MSHDSHPPTQKAKQKSEKYNNIDIKRRKDT